MPLSSLRCSSLLNEDFGCWCLRRLRPKPLTQFWSSQAPRRPVCFSDKPFCVFQLSPSELITRWWTPSTSWSHVSLKAACLLKRELFSRRTLLTGGSLNVSPPNSSRRAPSNVSVAVVVSRAEGEVFAILSSGAGQRAERERGSASLGFRHQPCSRPAV